MSENPILVLDDIYSGYGEIKVLKGVSVEFIHGTITCIIGANGAGKSTLLKTIFGLLKVDSGAITYEGKDITKLTPLDILKRGISYVPQGRCNFPALTIQENLEMGGYIRQPEQVRVDIDNIYERFPVLNKRKKDFAGNLSGGQQQILEMAMALILHPQILLIDEPTLGLAPNLVNEVFETIRNISLQGTTVVLVEQNAKKALEISDYAFVLELGKNWMQGTAREISDDPKVKLHYLGL